MTNRSRRRSAGRRHRRTRPLASLKRSYRRGVKRSRCRGTLRRTCKSNPSCKWVYRGKNRYCRKSRNRRHRRRRRTKK